jgi:hypothetical protein
VFVVIVIVVVVIVVVERSAKGLEASIWQRTCQWCMIVVSPHGI